MIAALPIPGREGLCVSSTPKAILSTRSYLEVLDILRETERIVNAKKWIAVGFVSYDSAPAFDSAFRAKGSDTGVPLIRFGLFEAGSFKPFEDRFDRPETMSWLEDLSVCEYSKCIDLVKEHIRSGDTYQVNFTFRLSSRIRQEPLSLFHRLYSRQRTPYGCFILSDDFAVCSASPELFFDLCKDRLVCRPMKGTAKRGKTQADDEGQADWLQNSAKNRAENVMIVDMIRNDLGRVAKTGSVKVDELFRVEPYPTLWQMTSTVSATTNAGIAEIFRALFPCASITGAPKVKTMEIIRDLEHSPRGLYTGAVGCILPGQRARFGVAIRTAVVDQTCGTAVYGTGGGIVADSDAESEYAEALLKAKILLEE